MIYPWITKLGGRRFLLCFYGVTLGAILNATGTVSGDALVLIFGGTVFAYVAGNGAQKYIEAKKDNESISERSQD